MTRAEWRQQCWWRDVPVSCRCEWTWRTSPFRWVRARTGPGCPWHTGSGQAKQEGMGNG